MREAWALWRLTAVLLVGLLLLTLAAPAPAEAQAMAAVGIAAAAVIGVILIVYLIVANTRASQTSAEATPVVVACVESDAGLQSCWPAAAAAPPAPVPEPIAPQS